MMISITPKTVRDIQEQIRALGLNMSVESWIELALGDALARGDIQLGELAKAKIMARDAAGVKA